MSRPTVTRLCDLGRTSSAPLESDGREGGRGRTAAPSQSSRAGLTEPSYSPPGSQSPATTHRLRPRRSLGRAQRSPTLFLPSLLIRCAHPLGSLQSSVSLRSALAFLIPQSPLRPLLHLDHVGDVQLDELAIEGLGCWGDFWDDELGEVRDHVAVLAVAVKGERGTAFDLDRGGVVDGEDAVADLVLAVEEDVAGRRGDAELVDIVSGVVWDAADVEVLPDLLAVLVHHRLDHAPDAEGDFVAFPGFAAKGADIGELVVGGRIIRHAGRDPVCAGLGVFRHRVLASELEPIAIEGSGDALEVLRRQGGSAEHGKGEGEASNGAMEG